MPPRSNLTGGDLPGAAPTPQVSPSWKISAAVEAPVNPLAHVSVYSEGNAGGLERCRGTFVKQPRWRTESLNPDLVRCGVALERVGPQF